MRFLAILLFALVGCSNPVVSEPECKCDANNPLHVCAFHIWKDDPKSAIEVHHYCAPLPNGVFQCTLYESSDRASRLIGVEYVISEELYNSLSEVEKKDWHPHYFEVKMGLLTTPDLSPKCENNVMQALVRSYGKSIHTWPDLRSDLPVGKPRIAWAFENIADVSKSGLDRHIKERNGLK